jgi:hypothetical protein
VVDSGVLERQQKAEPAHAQLRDWSGIRWQESELR